jgi:hypothetical protein
MPDVSHRLAWGGGWPTGTCSATRPRLGPPGTTIGSNGCAARRDSQAGPREEAVLDDPEATERLRARRPNHVWAQEFQFHETTDRRRLKSPHVVDEDIRESLAMRVGRGRSADEAV